MSKGRDKYRSQTAKVKVTKLYLSLFQVYGSMNLPLHELTSVRFEYITVLHSADR